MEITYDTCLASDLWRCQTTMLLGRPRGIIAMLAFPLLTALRYNRHLLQTNVAGFGLTFLAFAAIWLSVLLLGIWILNVYQWRKPRVCTTRLGQDGILDITPSKTTTIPWSEVKDIQNRNGNILIYQSGLDGVYIPRSAFQNSAQADRFALAAQAARRGDYSQIAPAPQNADNP